jgi:anthranilate synthase/aminodeoxychorismate synthase-like glutamine amidotransferase
MRLLVLDNYDSFTFMLVDYLQQAGASCEVRRNDEPMADLTVAADTCDGLVLSPGPGTPATAANLLPMLARYHNRMPVLGVCLGHQAIGQFFGAMLGPAHQPMHGKVSVVSRTDTDRADPLLAGLPGRFAVTRYHSLILSALPPDLRVLAATDAGELMALRHRTLPVWGVQFHPEAVLTEYGLPLLQNWIGGLKSYRPAQLTTR